MNKLFSQSITRRGFMQTSAAVTGLSAASTSWAAEEGSQSSLFVFVGTYTRGDSEGIYTLRFNRESGELTPVVVTGDITNPSFLTIDPVRGLLFAVNEMSDFNGQKTGAVSAYKINKQSGELSFINHQSANGTGPCYVALDQTRKFVLVANYGGGSVTVLPVMDDGSLGETSSHVQHEGSSVNERRQNAPHAHSIRVTPDNKYVYAADLGLDKMLIYKFGSDAGSLTPADPTFMKTAPGAGPRHFDFHPTLDIVYVILELNSTMTACKRNPATGALEKFQTLSTLPDDFSGNNSCADVHVSPNGKWLYGSNRGHDSIAIFALDENGNMDFAGTQSTLGETPRNFNIDPSGNFLLAANQNSDSITVFKINDEDGSLSPVHTYKNPTPVCIQFMSM